MSRVLFLVDVNLLRDVADAIREQTPSASAANT